MASRPINAWIVDDDQSVRWVLEKALRQEQMDVVLREVRVSVPDVTLRLFNQARVQDLGLIGYAALAWQHEWVSGVRIL